LVNYRINKFQMIKAYKIIFIWHPTTLHIHNRRSCTIYILSNNLYFKTHNVSMAFRNKKNGNMYFLWINFEETHLYPTSPICNFFVMSVYINRYLRVLLALFNIFHYYFSIFTYEFKNQIPLNFPGNYIWKLMFLAKPML